MEIKMFHRASSALHHAKRAMIETPMEEGIESASFSTEFGRNM
jgi:hypothetical protein